MSFSIPISNPPKKCPDPNCRGDVELIGDKDIRPKYGFGFIEEVTHYCEACLRVWQYNKNGLVTPESKNED